MRAARLFFVVAGLCVVASPSRASADVDDPAEVAFDRGIEHMEAGRFARACPLIEESYKLDPQPGALFTLAECEAGRGRLATALARYEEYLVMHASLPLEKKLKQGDRERDARRQRDALAEQAPRLTLVLSEKAPSGTIVTLDGATLSDVELGVSLAHDPGEHMVTVQVPGGPVTKFPVKMSARESRNILLTVEEPPQPSQKLPLTLAPSISPPQGDAGVPMKHIGAAIAGGVGVAGLGVGVAMAWLAAEGKEGSYVSSSLAGFGVGLVGAVTVAALLFTQRAEEPAAASASSGLRFGVDVGPNSMGLQLVGAW